MERSMRRVAVVTAALCALIAADVSAQGNWRPGDFGSLRFRLGVFEPAGSSDFWDQYFTDFTGAPSSLEGLTFGVDYLWRTSRSSGLLFGGSFFSADTTVAYRDWETGDGQDISHLVELEMADLTAAYVVRLGDGGIRPYLGAGGGILWWQFREEGSFIDFGDPELPIVFASYLADGTTWELFALAGLDVPLGYRWSFFFEGRYRWADDELNKDFAGFGTVDLSGLELAGGLSFNF